MPIRRRMDDRIKEAASVAFSLVEMLVVVVILAILVGLALPVMTRARIYLNDNQCASNLRQLQLANITYASENGGQYVPIFVNGNSGSGSDRTPWQNNRSFVSLLGVTEKQAAGVPSKLLCPVKKITSLNGYGCNYTGLSGGISTANYVRGFRVTQIPRPGQTISFIDAVDWQVEMSARDDYTGSTAAETQQTHAPAYRHVGSFANAAFWDGHVEKLPRQTLETNTSLWRVLE